MAHFIVGKYPNMQQMRETFAFLAEFFVLADILILLVLKYSEEDCVTGNIFICRIRAYFFSST